MSQHRSLHKIPQSSLTHLRRPDLVWLPNMLVQLPLLKPRQLSSRQGIHLPCSVCSEVTIERTKGVERQTKVTTSVEQHITPLHTLHSYVQMITLRLLFYPQTYVHEYTHAYMHVYKETYILTHIHTYISTCIQSMHACTHIHAQTRTRPYIHTFIESATAQKCDGL